MSKEIRFNAFAMNCVGHMAPGLWRHPRDCSNRYIDLNYWTGLARLLERGKFDGLFLADVLGPYDVYQGRADAAIYSGIQTIRSCWCQEWRPSQSILDSGSPAR
jgi:long-chain alkane monooxygenase